MAWTAKSGARISSAMQRFLDDLSRKLRFDIVATSGERDPNSQARAMLNKLNAKGEGELYGVYKDDALIKKLLATPRTEAAWAEVIRKEGAGISRHLVGGAVDVRSRDLTSSQIAEVKAAVAALGGRTLVEYDHIHIDLPASYLAGMAARTWVKWVALTWVVGGIAVLAGGLYRRKQTYAALPAPVRANPRRRKRRSHR